MLLEREVGIFDDAQSITEWIDDRADSNIISDILNGMMLTRTQLQKPLHGFVGIRYAPVGDRAIRTHSGVRV